MRVINVRHEVVDGWHTFTSPQVPGLFIAGSTDDLKDLYEDIPKAVEALIEHDLHQNATVRLLQFYSDYLKGLPKEARPDIITYSVDIAA